MKIIISHDKGIKYVADTQTNLSFVLFDLQRTKTRNQYYSGFITTLHEYFKNLYSECKTEFPTKDTDRFFCCLIDEKKMAMVFSLSISYENKRDEISLIINNTCKNSAYTDKNLLKEVIQLCISKNANIEKNRKNMYAKLHTSNSHFCSTLREFYEAKFHVHSVPDKNGDLVLLKYHDKVPNLQNLKHTKEQKNVNRIPNLKADKIIKLIESGDEGIQMYNFDGGILTFVFFDLSKNTTKNIHFEFINLLEKNFQKLYRDCNMKPNTAYEFRQTNTHNKKFFLCVLENAYLCKSQESCSINLIFSLTMSASYDKGEPHIYIENDCLHPAYHAKQDHRLLSYAISWCLIVSPFITRNRHNMFKILNTSSPIFYLSLCNFLKSGLLPYMMEDDKFYMRYDKKNEPAYVKDGYVHTQ